MAKIKLTNGGEALVDDQDLSLVGKINWHRIAAKKTFYARGYDRENKRTIFMHRLISGFPVEQVDHINGDGLNNLRENLRAATPNQNRQNRSKHQRKCTSKYKGVSWRPGKNGWQGHWRVAIAGKEIGWFYGKNSETEAALAYDKAAKEKFGKFARLNFPTKDPK